MIDRTRLSRSTPPGDPEEWPIADHQAVQALIYAANARKEDHPIDRVTLAAGTLGLPPRHWLTLYTLAAFHGMFPLRGGLYFAEDATAFLENATADDLRDPWMVELAHRLVRDLEEALAVLAEGTPDDLTDRQLRAWVGRLAIEGAAWEVIAEMRASRAGRRRHNR